MESGVSGSSPVAEPEVDNTGGNGSESARGNAEYAEMSGDNFEEMALSCSESETWVQNSSMSSIGNQAGPLGPQCPPYSGESASLPSCSNVSCHAAASHQQGSGARPAVETVQAADEPRKLTHEADSSLVVINALKREVFATVALLRALRMHAAAQTRGVSAASQQQLAAAVAPLVRSFEMLSERLVAAEAAKEAPPGELQEQHIHPFLFVLAQQQLQHKQQQGLSKQQQQLQQSCMRALASAVLRSLDQLLTVGLSRCRSAAGRRCLHALILALTNCVLQAAQRLQSAPTQPTAANAAAAAAAAALASEAYGGTLFSPASPAAEEELLLQQCLDLLTSSLLGPAGGRRNFCSISSSSAEWCCLLLLSAAAVATALSLLLLPRAAGNVFSDICVVRTFQCCLVVSLSSRASPLLRNAAAARAVAITRHLFASEGLTLLSLQLKQSEGDGPKTRQEANGAEGPDSDPPKTQQQAASPPQFMPRLGSALALRSLESGYLPLRQVTTKSYGLECRQRFVILLGGLLSIEEPQPASSSSGIGTSNNSSLSSNSSSRASSLPPFIPPPDATSYSTPSEGPREQKNATLRHGKGEDGSPPRAATASAGGTANPSASATGPRDNTRLGGPLGLDRDFEGILGDQVKEKSAVIETRLFCLRLLCVALESGRASICLFPSLLRPLQAQVLPVVLQQDTRSAPLLLLSLTLRVLGNFILFLRPHIKDEMERCLYQLLRLSISVPGGPSRGGIASEAQEIALDMLRELCCEDSFGLELLLNYDCDIRRSNAFGVLLVCLMQLAAPRIPALRGSYRPLDLGMDGVQASLSCASVPFTPVKGTIMIASDALAAKSTPQQNSPTGSVISPISSQLADNGKQHHHSAFHLRRAPQRAPLRAARSSADGSTAAVSAGAAETLATDAVGVSRPAGLSTANRLALAAIIRLIASLASRCEKLKRSYSRPRKQQQAVDPPQLNTESAAAYCLRIQKAQSLAQRRKNKTNLALGAGAFNANSKDAVPQLEALGLISNPASPKSLALFLKETKGLDLRTVGLYLSANKPWNMQVLKEFVCLFEFAGVGLVAALRDFLKTFRLPGESQQIERVMEAFADEYFRQQALVSCPHNEKLAAEAAAGATAKKQNEGANRAPEPLELSMWRWVPDEGFYCTSVASKKEDEDDGQSQEQERHKDTESLTSELKEFTPSQPPSGYVLMLHKDTVFVLSYSIIMLNTDQHNSQVRNKMRMEDFVKNNRGINNGSDLPPFFLQNIYLSIRHQEIKLKESAPPAAAPPHSAANQKAETPVKEQHHPDLFDVLADGWTPVEGANLGWGAFASPYGGSGDEQWPNAATEYVRVRDLPTSAAGDSSSSTKGGEMDLEEGLEYEMFKSLWSSGCFSVLRGAFEASLDLRQLEEIICGCLSLARVATLLNQVAAVNTIVAELCSYFVYSVSAHSQLILAPVMYLIRRSGGLLREEGWGAILELLLRLHALDLLPPALMGLDDFEGSGGTALYSLCNLTPPPFVAPSSRKDRAASRKGGGWLGDLTSILFALGDSDEESDGEDPSGMHGQLMAWPEELNTACDGLYVLRACTDFALLPSTLTANPRFSETEMEVPFLPQTASSSHTSSNNPGAEQEARAKPPQPAKGQLEDAQHEQPSQKKALPPASSTAIQAEDEETAAAMAPYLRLKAVLAHGVRVDLAVAELFRQVEPVSSLSIAVVLLVHILLSFPSLRQNPGSPPAILAQQQQKQQQQTVASAAANNDRASSAAGGASIAAASTVASVTSSSGVPSEGPPALQPPEDLEPPALPVAEVSMLSSYVVDAQRRGAEADSPRSSISSSSSAASTPVGTSIQSGSVPLLSLPPPVWSPLRGGTIPPLLSYREFTDRLFCLEVLGALMLSELTPGSSSLHPSKDYGTALVQKSPWVLCAVYLDAFLRRYAIGSAAAGVPNPLEAVGLASPAEQQQQQQPTAGCSSNPAWVFAMLNACSKDPLALATMRSVCSVFQAVGSRRLVETPTSPSALIFLSWLLAPLPTAASARLPHWELLFIERLVVTILRICLRLLSDEDSMLHPVYPPTAVSGGDTESSSCTAACQVAIHLLQLLTLLHPNVFCMHVQRIAQSAIILVSRLSLRSCNSPLLIQVLLALYQRLVPLPAFAPTAPLPQQLTQQQQQQDLAYRILASLSDWIRDPEALALLVLQHRNHYQMLLQTLMAFCIYTPPSPQLSSPASADSRAEFEGQHKLQQNKSEWPSGTSTYAANCLSLTLLASLIPSIGVALRTKARAVVDRLAAAANSGGAAANGSNCAWRARVDCQAMWLQALQVLAIVCSFGARPVKVKALAVLQQMIIRCFTTERTNDGGSSIALDGLGGSQERCDTLRSAETPQAATDAAAAAAAEYWAGAADDPYTWRLCLQLVVFPLLSFRFDYPYTPPAPGDAPPPPPQQQQQQQSSTFGQDSSYAFSMAGEAAVQQRDPNLTLPWMALPTRRRLTPEVAFSTFGIEEMYQRKAAAASLACRLFLTKMEHLLKPFLPKGCFVDFAPNSQCYESVEMLAVPDVHPGGIEGLLPPLTQLVQLLVAEAKQAPLIYRDAFLESMKNTLLVVLTCPAVAVSDIPAGLKARISPAEILQLLLPEQPRDKEAAEGCEKDEDAAQDATKNQALLGALSYLSESQRLVVAAVSPFISFAFPGVLHELLLILPTPETPRSADQQGTVGCMSTGEAEGAGGILEARGDVSTTGPTATGSDSNSGCLAESPYGPSETAPSFEAATAQ